MELQLPLSQRTLSAEQTEALGASLAHHLSAHPELPPFVALYGDLGVGKTAFVRGFASLFSDARVKSPTFSLVNEYRGDGPTVFHFDMYRITDEDELYSIGFYDYQDRGGICLVEWSENVPFALPQRYLRVEILKDSFENADSRLLTVDLVEN